MSKQDLILSRENAKRFSLENVSEFLEDSKLKHVLGGSGNGPFWKVQCTKGYVECLPIADFEDCEAAMYAVELDGDLGCTCVGVYSCS